MTQFYSRIDTEFHGDVYSIPFSYINKEEIEVYLDDVLFVDWEFLNESQIKFKNLPSEASNPTIVSIRRNTDISEKIVEYTNNTLLNKENLNLSQDQLLYAVQEIYDNNTQFNIDLNASVDEKVEKVTEAVEQLHVLDEAVINAVNAAETATEQANIAIEKSELTASTADKALEDIDTLKTNAINELDTIVEDSVETVSGLANEITNNAQNIINRLGINLFDTKVSDHVLEGEEALGWALQGTYVYKEGVAGSRTGYADFYNRCVEEYENAEYDNSLALDWTQPKLSANGTLGGSSFAVIASSENVAGVGAYGAFDGTTSSSADCWHSNSESNSWITLYNPTAIKVTKLQITNRNDGTYTYPIYGGVVYGSNDNSDWEQITTFTNSVLGSNATWNIDLSTNKNYYKYYKIEANNSNTYVTIGKVVITAKEISLPIKKNANGHRFYDISYKEAIDNLYAITGIADFYGVDLENERIFLPRNDYFVQLTGDTSKVNDTIEAGLPNITGNYATNASGQVVDGAFTTGTTTLKNYTSSLGPTDVGAIGFDASLSNPIYGNSDTVQPPSSLKLLYYCVGNTKVEKALTEVTEITTSENDTLPLFYNFYSQEDMTTTGAYINASLGSYLSGNVYPTAYNELVNKLGEDNVKANTDTYTDYDFVVNQDDMTFRLPLKNGQEIMFATGVKGNGMTLGLTDGTNNAGTFISGAGLTETTSDYGSAVGSSVSHSGLTNNVAIGVTTDSTKSGIELDTESITIPDGWNLYYKVANAVTNLELLDVAKVMDEAVLRSSLIEAHVVTETYQNGSSWYRIWSDGWCEQGGTFVYAANPTINLLVPYKKDNYSVQVTDIDSADTGGMGTLSAVASYTNSSITFTTTTEATEIIWEAKGFMA